MHILGEWYECDDGFHRPVLRGEILTKAGKWEPVPFLVDTGADRTVFCASTLGLLGFRSIAMETPLGGVGGLTQAVAIETLIRFPLSTGGLSQFRGEYAALTDPESLDMCVLGRDILDLFAVIIDRPGNTVSLVRGNHHYLIQAS